MGINGRMWAYMCVSMRIYKRIHTYVYMHIYIYVLLKIIFIYKHDEKYIEGKSMMEQNQENEQERPEKTKS